MKNLLTVLLFLLPTAVSAHVGHLGEIAGHSHWLGAAAIGLGIALGAWGIRKGPEKTDAEEEAADMETEEAQEA